MDRSYWCVDAIYCFVFVVLLTPLARLSFCQNLPAAELAFVPPSGIELKLRGVPGLTYVGFHYSINKAITGTNGQFNYDVASKSSDGYFHHTNPNANAHAGDTVNYALYYVVNGVGHQQLGLSATLGSSGGGNTGGTVGSSTGSSGSGNTGTGGSGYITTVPHTAPSQATSLVFHDDFSSGSIDKTKWMHEVSAFGGGNWEFQIYSPDQRNSYVKNGVLYLKPTLTADTFSEDFIYHGILDVQKQWGICTKSEFYGCLRNSKDAILPPIMSAKLITKHTYSIKYGRIEVEAQMPIGDWIWPAIWLMPRDEVYGGWPRSGEIDMVETRCNRQYGDIGIKRMMSTLHWGTNWDKDRWPLTTNFKDCQGCTWGDDFHTYSMDWDPSGIILSVDNVPVLTARTPQGGYFQKGGFSGTNIWSNGGHDAPFDQEFYFQMNVAVGGTNGFFPDNVQNGGYAKPWSNSDPSAPKVFYESRSKWMPTWDGEKAAMKIRSVKIWRK